MSTKDKAKIDPKEEIKLFKRELECYPLYKKKLDEINEKIDLNEYEESGLKAIRYDTVKVSKSVNESAIANKRLSLIEKGKKLEAEKERIQKQIDHIEKILCKMNPKIASAMVHIYAYERTYQDVVDNDKMFWTDGGLYYAIESELKNVFKDDSVDNIKR